MVNKYSLIFIAFLCASISGFGQGSESFTNLNAPTGSYGNGSYVGDNGVTWSYGQARLVNTTFNITGTSIGFGPSGVRFVSGLSGTNGVGNINYSVRSYFTGGLASDRTFQLYVNGTLRETFTLSAMATVFNRSVTVNATGNVTIEFRSIGPAQIVLDNVSWTAASTDAVDWCNVQFPNTPSTITQGQNFDVYAQAYEPGVTPAAGVGSGLVAWIGYSTSNNNPSSAGWTWIAAPFNVQVGNNDEFSANIGPSLPVGTYYYASRFRLNSGPFVYGGSGGIWNNDSVQLTVIPDQVDFCNVDYPKTGTAFVGGTFNVYAQAYEPGLTNAPPAQAPGLSCWIGYNTNDVDPFSSPGWTWVPASYDSDFMNNDQFVADLMSGPTAITVPGTYYFASRWQLNGSSYSYGGIFDDNIGNFWDATTNNNGILTVTYPPCSDLIFSEYVEGSGFNKYLEIFNGTSAAINLSNYTIQVYNNGSATPTATAALSGTIASGGVVVYKHPSATAYTGTATVLTPNPITFNGNDALVLRRSGVIIDVIGQIGFNPGTAWTGGGGSTLNRTLIRKSSVQVGDSNGYDTFSPNTEWLSFPMDSVSELGYHFSSCYPDRELQLEIPVGTIVYCGHDYDFGTQVINTNTDIVLRLRNLGDLPLQINSLAFVSGAQYSLVSPPATPFTIPATSFQDITIRFNPDDIGLFLDTLNIGSNDASESSCSIDFSGISESNCDNTVQIIAAQDFESSASDTWNYTAVHAPIAGYWSVTPSLANIPSAQSGNNFWGISDLERSGHIGEIHELSFSQDISSYINVELSFQYFTINLDNSDTFDYEIFYDGVSQGIVDISANTNAWTEVIVNVPNSVGMLDIIFYPDIDASNDNAGLDNLLLTSTLINTATWSGSQWNWNDGTTAGTAPSSSTTVVLNDNYNTGISGSFQACQLTVNPTYTLTVANSTFVEVENFAIIDGNVVVETQGSFVQRENYSNGFVLNAGATSQVNKTTSVLQNHQHYTYWSSPVFGAQVQNALSLAPAARRFWYNAANYLDVTMETNNDNGTVAGHDDIDDNGDDWQLAPGTMVMAPGQGFAATVLNSGSFPGTRTATFQGRLNTGTLTTSIFYNGANGDNDWNLIGNPYPSAISFNDFYDLNTVFIDGAAYLWSQASPASSTNNGNETWNYSANDYAIITRFSGNTAGGSGVIPASFIPSGQAFFVKGLSNGSVTFNNTMRMADATSNNQFFRFQETAEPNRLWLNLTSDNGIFNQILVAYVAGATNGNDGMAYDAVRNLSTGVASIIYTTIENESGKKFAIQGKDINSLTTSEVIPIGFYSTIAEPTIYSLSIPQLEGGFLMSHDIFLKDNYLNILHNLSASAYIFNSEVGEFNNRFEILFQDQPLSIIENEVDHQDLSIIELADGRVKFSVGNTLTIQSVEIMDLVGRTIYHLKGNSSEEIYHLEKLSQSAYFAKVELSNGQTITKRAIKRK